MKLYVTFTPRHHQLTAPNTGHLTASGWSLIMRPSGASFTGKTIERVNVHTGDVGDLIAPCRGAHVGMVTVHPADNHYVFIHGPETLRHWHYDFHHRRGGTRRRCELTSMRWILLRRILPARCAATVASMQRTASW